MKKIAFILLLTMVTLFSAEAHKYKNKNAHVTISIQNFYNELSPYGDWIYSSDFGYVWRPYFDYPEAFRPYSSNGNWVYTELGWTWVSNYNWGWATFHYGRWDFDQYLGWLWIPGYDWAPAWVTWGSYDNYWGWAPMGPNIYVQYNSNWFAPDPWWTFVPRHHFCSDNWNDYIYDRPVYVTNITYINNVYVENNYTTVNHNSWYQGPRVSEVERYYGHRVSTMEVVDNERHENAGVRNNQLNIYRPTVDSRRNDSRPTEYRNIEQAHRNSTSLSTNPRTNNPGENRSRANKAEPRNTSQLPSQNTSSGKTQNRVEPRKTDQSLPNRSADVTKDSRETKVTPRTNTKYENRTGSANRETKVEPRATSQMPADRNSKGTSVKPQRNDTELNRNSGVPESNRSKTNPARIDNKSSQQTRNNTENRGNVNSSASHGSGSKQAANVEPSQKPKTTDVASTSNSRTQNTDRKQSSREVVKQGENQKSVVSTEKRKSGNKTSR